MERKQDTEYKDPFELLKNMNDVIMCYEPKNKQSIEVATEIPKSVEKSKTTSSRWSHSFKMTTGFSNAGNTTSSINQNSSFSQMAGMIETHHPSQGSSTTGHKSRFQKHAPSIVDQVDLNSTNITSIADVSLPKIKRLKTQDASHQKQHHLSSRILKNANQSTHVKTLKEKQEEKILDIHNIPEVNQMFDHLDLKYEKIKKLKEEFNDIKTQFGGVPATATQKQASVNSSVDLNAKRLTARTRGSFGYGKLMSKMSIDNTITIENEKSIHTDEKKDDNRVRSRTTAHSKDHQGRQVNQIMKNMFSHNGKENIQNQNLIGHERAIDTKRRAIKAVIQYNNNNEIQQVKHIAHSKVFSSRKLSNNASFSLNKQNEPLCIQDEAILAEGEIMNKSGYDSKLFNTNGYLKQLSIQKVRSQALERFNKLYPKQRKNQQERSKSRGIENQKKSIDAPPNDKMIFNTHNVNKDKTEISASQQVQSPQNVTGANIYYDEHEKNSNVQNFPQSLFQTEFKRFSLLDEANKESTTAKKSLIDPSKPLHLEDIYKLISKVDGQQSDTLKPLHEIYKPPPGKQMISSVSIDDQMDIKARLLGLSQSKVDQTSLSLQKGTKFSGDKSGLQPQALFKTVDDEVEIMASSLINMQETNFTKPGTSQYSRNLDPIREEETSTIHHINSVITFDGKNKDEFQTQSTSNGCNANQFTTSECAGDGGKQQQIGVSLYEQYKQNQIKQLKLLKKQQKKHLKKIKKQQTINSVENIYMRDAIMAILHSNNPNKRLNSQQTSQKGKKSRKQSRTQNRTKSSISERTGGNLRISQPCGVIDDAIYDAVNDASFSKEGLMNEKSDQISGQESKIEMRIQLESACLKNSLGRITGEGFQSAEVLIEDCQSHEDFYKHHHIRASTGGDFRRSTTNQHYIESKIEVIDQNQDECSVDGVVEDIESDEEKL